MKIKPIFLSRNEACSALYDVSRYVHSSLYYKKDKDLKHRKDIDEFPTKKKVKTFLSTANKLDKLGPSTDRTPEMVLISYDDYLKYFNR